jgi:hypothetical protein
MLFVSRHKNYRHEIWSGEQRFVRSAGGAENLVTVFPNFTAEFKPGRLTEPERQDASRQFGFSSYGHDVRVLAGSMDLGPEDAPGPAPYAVTAAATAMPYREDGVMIGAVGQSGDAYSGYDPQFHMASFDTDTDIDYSMLRAHSDVEKEAAKAECERRLLSSPDLGGAFVIVTSRTIAAPWAKYDTLKGQAAETINKILSIIDDAGFDASYVLEYERMNLKRDKVMVALQEKHQQQQEAQQLAVATREALQAAVR